MHNALFTLTKTYGNGVGMVINVSGKVFLYGSVAAVSMLMLIFAFFRPADLMYIITEGGVIKDKCYLWEFHSFSSTVSKSNRKCDIGNNVKVFRAVASLDHKSSSAMDMIQAQRQN